MIGACRERRISAHLLLGFCLLSIAGCDPQPAPPAAQDEGGEAETKVEAAPDPYVFPEGITEIRLPFGSQSPEREIELPYDGPVIPRAGDEVVLEAETPGGVTEVGRARVIGVGSEQLRLRLTTKVTPPVTHARILAQAVHRCDVLAASPLDARAVAEGIEYGDIDPAAIEHCGQAVGKYPATPRFHFQLGRALDAHRQQETALAHYRRVLALDPDYAAALLALAGKYINGEGVNQDIEAGVQLLQRAYDLGLSRAAYTLGRFYEQPVPDTVPDLRMALAYYTTAALQGDLPAQLRLAEMYEQGQGVEADPGRALDWYEMAAEQGHAASQLRLGRAYARGQGRDQDWDEARQWMDRAANQGVIDAQVALGRIFEGGHGLDKADYGKAMYWYRQAAEQESGLGQYHLGRLYAMGLGVEKDKELARKWLLLAKAQGVQAAASLLEPEKPPAAPVQAAAERPLPADAPRNLKSARRWRVRTQGYMDSACLDALMEELADLDIRVVGSGSDPDVTLIVTMNNPEYYTGSFGPFRFSGYNIQFRAEAIRNADNMRLFYSHGDEAGDDRSEACVDSVDEITDDLSDLID